MLHYKADIKTVVYLSLTTAGFFFQWNLTEWNPFIYIVHIYLSITVAVIAHNHNHTPMWKIDPLNKFTDYWITCLNGVPAFVWIPTHNKNHHKFNNKEGDYTLTYRYSEKNNLVTLGTYPTISSYFQQTPTMDFLKKSWERDKGKFFYYVFQYVALVAVYVIAFYLDWKKAILYVLLPHQASLNTVLVFNYLQHVHTDEKSKVNHSRNFVSPMNRFMLFNNGLHTVHHENANLHWSLLPEAHDKFADKITPELNQRGFWGFVFRSYILGLFMKKYRTSSLRLERITKENMLKEEPKKMQFETSLN